MGTASARCRAGAQCRRDRRRIRQTRCSTRGATDRVRVIPPAVGSVYSTITTAHPSSGRDAAGRDLDGGPRRCFEVGRRGITRGEGDRGDGERDRVEFLCPIGVHRAHGVAVDVAAVEAWDVDLGDHVGGEDVAVGVFQSNEFRAGAEAGDAIRNASWAMSSSTTLRNCRCFMRCRRSSER